MEVSVATKVQKEEKQKGDLMENNAEAMEYSSEDFSDDNLEDLNYAGYKNKKRRVGGGHSSGTLLRGLCRRARGCKT